MPSDSTQQPQNSHLNDITTSSVPAPSSWTLLRIWFLLGLQSFGGGAATLTLIRRATVEQNAWVTEAEFTRYWSLCQITPGINLFALTILIGRQLAGWRGIGLALVGLLLPSVFLTILITAFYSRMEHLWVMRSALRGVIPASVGLGLATAIQMARPPLQDGYREGKVSFGIGLTLLLVSGLLIACWHPPILLILIGAGAVSAALQWQRQRGLPVQEEADA